MEMFCSVWKCHTQLEVGSSKRLAALLICKTTAVLILAVQVGVTHLNAPKLGSSGYKLNREMHFVTGSFGKLEK